MVKSTSGQIKMSDGARNWNWLNRSDTAPLISQTAERLPAAVYQKLSPRHNTKKFTYFAYPANFAGV